MVLSSDKQFKAKDKDTERITSKKGGDARFWEVHGTDGRVLVVDVEKAREAMRYAMRQDTEKIKPKEDDKDYFWEMRGTDGCVLVVDVEKAREAMRYAMRQNTGTPEANWTTSVEAD